MDCIAYMDNDRHLHNSNFEVWILLLELNLAFSLCLEQFGICVYLFVCLKHRTIKIYAITHKNKNIQEKGRNSKWDAIIWIEKKL
jgi:hypothetical protein